MARHIQGAQHVGQHVFLVGHKFMLQLLGVQYVFCMQQISFVEREVISQHVLGRQDGFISSNAAHLR